jgi:tryptophan halogenase
MDFLREECDRWFGKNRPLARVPSNIARRLQMATNKLPTHEEWLRSVVHMPEYPVR